METSSADVRADGVIVDYARGVLAERFGTDIATADRILGDVARAQRRTVTELAGAVVESCVDGSKPLPRRLYLSRNEFDDAA